MPLSPTLPRKRGEGARCRRGVRVGLHIPLIKPIVPAEIYLNVRSAAF